MDDISKARLMSEFQDSCERVRGSGLPFWCAVALVAGVWEGSQGALAVVALKKFVDTMASS